MARFSGRAPRQILQAPSRRRPDVPRAPSKGAVMKLGRVLLVTALIGGAVGLAMSCGSSKACNPSTCNGCCDVSGICQPGTSSNSCGINAGTCNACGFNQVCTL